MWIKIENKLPNKEGLYKVKVQVSDIPDNIIETEDEFNGTDFIHYRQFVNEWFEEIKPKIIIDLIDYNYKCGDGCCTNYGTITKVNGVELENNNQDVSTILTKVLEHLGYEVEVNNEYDFD